MGARDDGGPAFPVIDTSQNTATGETTIYQAVHSGISVRDYFAAKAMQGLFSTMEDGPALQRAMKLGGFTNPHDWIANTAYAIADAMLKARAS